MKRILPLLLALVLALSAAVPAYATGDGNMDSGGSGMGDGTKTNYWNPGMDGVRVSIVDAASRSVVRTPIDLTNKTPAANIAHFGKVSKLSYNAGRGLSVTVSGYSYRNPSQSLPKIISTGSSKASIAAIRSYFTDEQVIRSIAGYSGMDFDTLVGGDYKLVVEPLAYLCYNGQQFAMTATEAALYDQMVGGDLRVKLGSLTHKNLPLAIFLEEADLGYTAWPGSRTEKASNGDIISSLGIGIVRFNEVTTPPEPGEYDYEYRVNTEVITSVEVRGGQSDPDNPVSVRFNIQGRTYTVSNVYYPDGDSQLVWVRWRTPADPCVIAISVSVSGGGSAQSTITCNIVDLDGNDPPNPLADDRNDAFRLSSIPEKEQVTSATWGIWSPWWQENWEWVEHWQKCWHTDDWTDADGKTHRDRWYPDATYVGRACYVRLSDMNRAKIQFVTGIVSNQYHALQMTILNRNEGQVDVLRLQLTDLLGRKMTSNPNFSNGVMPHIWDDGGKVDWYVYHPTRQDYEILSGAVSDYLEVFQDRHPAPRL